MTITEKLDALRTLMKERNMDAYMIPTSDFHETEYAGEHFQARRYMSGFSGSAGTLVVCHDSAGLWTDGRYFIQAAKELEGSAIDLMKMAVPGTPTILEYLLEHMKEGTCLGFDGRVINTAMAETMTEGLKEKNIVISCDEDLVDIIWEDRPSLPKEKAWELDVKYCGRSCKEKLKDIRAELTKKDCDMLIMTTLDEVAWTFNIRGNDIPCYPVVLAYAIVTTKETYMFVDASKLDDALKHTFAEENIIIKGYDDIYEFVKHIENCRVMMDDTTVNYRIKSSLSETVDIVNQKSPVQLWKACKNRVEQENNKLAHIKDAVAVTKFMYWLKRNIGSLEMTEVSAAEKLLEFRKQQEGFIEPSFDTIAAYNANAAMMHYHAVPETCATLKPEGLLLVDSGGQYYEGTTDITRTFALGPVSEEIRIHFTAVLRSLIALSKAKFLHGCIGMNLDILARGPIWDITIDYRGGSVHGLGFVFNVLYAPNVFRWKIVPERNDSAVLEEGMTTSNEPGIYIEGSHGIRLENEIVVCKGEENEYGQFMHFETITFVPMDLDVIDASLLTFYEKQWLNEYHKQVYEKVSPYLSDEEAAWLKTYTRAI